MRVCTVCQEPLHGDPQPIDLCDEHSGLGETRPAELLKEWTQEHKNALALCIEERLCDYSREDRQLVSYAPDLLESLKRLLIAPLSPNAQGIARATIAKAEGRA